jgi:hypothetical protein
MLLPGATEIIDPSTICSFRLPPVGTSTVSLICTASPLFSTLPLSVHNPLATTTVPAGVAAAALAKSITLNIASSMPINLRPMTPEPRGRRPARSHPSDQFIYNLIDVGEIPL